MQCHRKVALQGGNTAEQPCVACAAVIWERVCRAFENFFTKIYAYKIHQSLQKNFASHNFSVFVAYQANFCKICALMIKAQKHLKSSYKAKTLNLWRILANKAYQKADLWHFKVSKICKM